MNAATRVLLHALACGALLVAVLAAGAQTTSAPTGRVLLTVRDAAGNEAQFDRMRLEALPQVIVRTSTPWTDGVTAFSGPLVRDVLAAGMRGDQVKAFAINDYAVTIPMSDFERYGVIAALTRDGKRMRVRDKGPLWVIYPWSEHEELRNERYYARSIWQLKSITLE